MTERIDHAALLRQFLEERDREVHRLERHLDRNPSGLELLARPKEESAAIVLATLRELARRPFVTRPVHRPWILGEVRGDADVQAGLVLKPLLRRNPPVDEGTAAAILEALVPLASRHVEESIMRRRYTFPMASIVKWIDRRSPAWGPALQRAASSLLETIAAQPARHLDEVRALLETAASVFVAAGQITESAAHDRNQLEAEGMAPVRAQAVARPEDWLAADVGEALQALRRRAGAPPPPERPQPPARESPPASSRKPQKGQQKQQTPQAIARARFGELIIHKMEGARELRVILPSGWRCYQWPRGPLSLFTQFVCDKYHRPRFTVDVGWARDHDEWFRAKPSVRGQRGAADPANDRLGYYLPKPHDFWWQLRPPLDEKSRTAAWDAMDSQERLLAVMAQLPPQARDGKPLAFARVWAVLNDFEREQLDNHLGAKLLRGLSPEEMERSCRQVVDEAFAVLEREVLPRFEKALAASAQTKLPPKPGAPPTSSSTPEPLRRSRSKPGSRR